MIPRREPYQWARILPVMTEHWGTILGGEFIPSGTGQLDSVPHVAEQGTPAVQATCSCNWRVTADLAVANAMIAAHTQAHISMIVMRLPMD